jgi:non-specific serine/threonine protein kinase
LGLAFRAIRWPLFLESAVDKRSDPDISACLTARERKLVLLVVQGLSNKQIARQLGISVGTVKIHVHRILDKTGLPSRAAIAGSIVR